MAYCTVIIVRGKLTSSLTDLQITGIIAEVDALLDWLYTTAGVPALVMQNISSTWTAFKCMLRDPNAFRLGHYNEDRAVALKLLKEEFEGLLVSLGTGRIKSFNDPIV